MKRKSDEGFFTILGLIVLSLMLSFAQLLTQRAAALHKLAGAQERIDTYITALDMVHAQLQHGDLVLDELLLRMDADDEKAHHPGQQHAAQHGRPQRQQHLAQREPLIS